jgi:hypothetical protein
MRQFRRALLAFAIVILLPLGAHAAWWMSHDHPASWSSADWSSTGDLPPAAAQPAALVRIYAARVGRWRGIFAHHTWIVIKHQGGAAYARYDTVGWGQPVRRNGWPSDGLWYGNRPEIVAEARGPAAEALIPRLEAAIAGYPYSRRGSYRAWPGPNSNTFVAHVLAAVPDFPVALPPTAIGKDWTEEAIDFGWTPSGTGLRISAAGLLGLTVGWVEGVEINVLGAVAGLDLRRPALKLPGFGRIGVAVD